MVTLCSWRSCVSVRRCVAPLAAWYRAIRSTRAGVVPWTTPKARHTGNNTASPALAAARKPQRRSVMAPNRVLTACGVFAAKRR
jgi:hypothetical protein